MNVWTLDCDVVFCKPISVFRFDWVETLSQRPYAFAQTDFERAAQSKLCRIHEKYF